jgi:hypothetical protein
MKLDGSGRVTMPYQPAFFAYRNSSGNVGTEADISCGLTDVNIGSHYNTSNFRFTAPVAGTYSFTLSGMNHQSSVTSPIFKILKNGSQYHYFHIAATHPTSGCSTVIMTLAVNDYINCKGSNFHFNGGTYKYPIFCGHLLG